MRIIVVDRTRSPFLKDGESFYLNRLSRYVNVELVEVKPVPIKKGRSTKEILAKEARPIDKKLLPGEILVVLDRSGTAYDSLEFASWIENLFSRGVRLNFVLGGPLGLSQDIMNRANEVLSLSKLTLTHEMSRLFLLEQLYRAFTIIRGESYHK